MTELRWGRTRPVLEGEQLITCIDCGAVIADDGVTAHTRFHSILSGHAWSLAVLRTAHGAATVHDRYDVIERMSRRHFDSWTNDALTEVIAAHEEDNPRGDTMNVPDHTTPAEARAVTRRCQDCDHRWDTADLKQPCPMCASRVAISVAWADVPDGGTPAETELDKRAPGRMSPRECIAEARESLNKAYGCGGTRECWPFIMAAVDWQRRAIEQLAPPEMWCKDTECQWRRSRHYHADGFVHAPGQAIW